MEEPPALRALLAALVRNEASAYHAIVPVFQVLDSRVPVKVWTRDLEESARKQLVQTGALPFVFRHVAAMADTHWGMGATVGSVMATQGAICPAAVGVDIGCGMAAVKTRLDASALDGKLSVLRHAIERSIPVGFHQRREPHPAAVEFLTRSRAEAMPSVATESERTKAALQCGTLGGGNHFIEVCADQDDSRVWVMLHSGSRNIGKVTAERHIGKAKDWTRKAGVELPNPDLAYVSEGSAAFDSYVADLTWCQDFALRNRQVMLADVLKDLRRVVGTEDLGLEPEIHCHHNYVAWERHFGRDVMVTRKGAIRARRGDLGILPGSMGTESFIVRGLGNPEAFESAPHGAGRRMSRGNARRTFTKEDLAAQTAGVECRKDAGVIDEIPGAYKPIWEVIQNSSDLVEVVARIKQVVCVKG
jgi:tRNA-splicing ligase RtcB (3'-phosphate/5'-hydroxy nucleic acid ligase)